ncbi:MAG: hypothetical protein ABI876_12875 [Bacteroidota bacterium]
MNTLYVRARTYVQNDSMALNMFQRPGPIPIAVWDTLICSPLPYYEVDDIVRAIYPDRSDVESIQDSLSYGAAHADWLSCRNTFNPDLRLVSTTGDRTATLIFTRIDSLLVPNLYVMGAYLYQNKDKLASLQEIAASRPLGLIYFFVFDKQLVPRKIIVEPLGE